MISSRSFLETNVAERSLASLARQTKRFNFRSVGNFEYLVNGEYRVDLEFTILETLERDEIIHFDSPALQSKLSVFFSNRHFLLLNDAIWDLKTGMAFTADRKTGVAETSSRSIDQLRSTVLPVAFRPQTLYSNKLYLILPSNGYYHWLLEDLPNFLHTFNLDSKVEVLVWKGAPSYVFDFLRLMKIDHQMTERFMRIKNVVTLSHSGNSGFTSQQDLRVLRSFFDCVEVQDLGVEKCFVSRLGSSRSPFWEPELLQIMENKKWKVIQFEKMKLSEQIAIAKNARVLAGIHGAGLSNMIGMNHGGVVELGGESFRKCYLALAKVCSLEYTRLGFNEYKEYTPKNLVRKLAKEISASY